MPESSEIDRYRAQLQATLMEFEGVEGFSEEAWEAARDMFQIRRFDKNEALVNASEPGRYIFFLCSGLVRLFYETESAKQFNKSFAWEDMFVAGALNPAGADGTSGNEYGIEALEPVTALAISLRDFGRLLATAPDWAGFRDAYIRWLADRKARRERQLLLESAEERYRGFLKDFPEAAGRIPQYHIALYLGITDVALSRIKKRAGI
ncbi:MAG: Crp/Fnr family transcriptional regulator [bacterium]|nr:Crp/Fnr family transcriptional regulator [bacterium]